MFAHLVYFAKLGNNVNFARLFDNMAIVLGISCYYHDSAAALTVNGEIVAAAQEERFTREKHTAVFPLRAINYCLEEAGLTLSEVELVVYYEKPLLKFERLLETYYRNAPAGIVSFVSAMSVWVKEKLFLKRNIRKGLSSIDQFAAKNMKLAFTEHHQSHSASAFFPSPFNKAAILTVDGVGEWATASISLGEGNKITVLKELHYPDSVGLLYSSFTYFLGFSVNSGEYKLMGLAPYGNADSSETKEYIEKIRNKIVKIYDDGSICLNQKYFRYSTHLKMINISAWEKLFGFPLRQPESKLEQKHCNLGFAIQHVTEEILLKMAHEAKRLTSCDCLCMAGGVALNCVANGKIKESRIFSEIFIQPASGDAGGALGAALAGEFTYSSGNRIVEKGKDSMKGSNLGPSFNNKQIHSALRRLKAPFEYFKNDEVLFDEVARLIAEGNVVGWFQGRMEFGPRALGNRTILADPRNSEMQRKLNLKIKYREGFRPFAPSVLIEDCGLYFESPDASPYMLLTTQVHPSRKNELPQNFYDLTLLEKLYVTRSDIPSVTHLDFSARIQTVHKETNPRYWNLINAFKKLTGYGIVVNTSFNVRGEPPVCSPEDAYWCFMGTEMDYLVMNNYILNKSEQLLTEEMKVWRKKFKPD